MKAVADHYTPREIIEGLLVADVDAPLVCKTTSLRDEVLSVLERQPDARIERAIRRMVAFKDRFARGPAEIALGDGEAGPPYEAHRELAARIAAL